MRSASSSCQRSSKMPMSLDLPFTVSVSTSRIARAQPRRQRVGGMRRCDDLLALGQRHHPRRDVDRIAEDIAVGGLDRRAQVEADADGEPCATHGGLVGDARLHLGRGICGLVGRREHGHRFVADRLDDTAAVSGAHVAYDGDAAADGRERLGVAQRFVETRAAANVGEKHRQVAGARQSLRACVGGRSVGWREPGSAGEIRFAEPWNSQHPSPTISICVRREREDPCSRFAAPACRREVRGRSSAGRRHCALQLHRSRSATSQSVYLPEGLRGARDPVHDFLAAPAGAKPVAFRRLDPAGASQSVPHAPLAGHRVDRALALERDAVAGPDECGESDENQGDEQRDVHCIAAASLPGCRSRFRLRCVAHLFHFTLRWEVPRCRRPRQIAVIPTHSGLRIFSSPSG